MKLFLRRLLYFIPIPLIITSVNYFGDPANIFNDKYVLNIANCLAQGEPVINVSDCDERLLQKYLIEKLNECPTEIVLGPSTVQLINSGYSTEKHFINNGIIWASLEDYLSIYYLYEKKGCKIRKILLGLGPWLLNDNSNLNRWKVLEREYNIILSKLLNTAVNNPLSGLYQYSKYKELFSLQYFKISLISLINVKKGGVTRLKDGSICYSAGFINADLSEVEKRARHNIGSDLTYALGNFRHLSKHYKLLFSNFVEYLQKQNIQVEFYLSPLHPIMYEYLNKNSYYHIVFETENYFKDYANSNKIQVIGSYNPAKYNFDNSYFLDGWHLKEKAIEKMLNRSISIVKH